MRNVALILIVSSLFIFQFYQINDETLYNVQTEFDDQEDSVSIDWVERPLGEKGIWIVDLFGYGNTITLDGNLSDWAGIPHDVFNDVDIHLAYDETYVYVAASWIDSTLDSDISCWNKTGHINSTVGIWEEVDGIDDILSIGFSNGTYTDMWIWTNSFLGFSSYAYETDGTGVADSGNLPFKRNEDPIIGNQPLYDNMSILITDHTTILNGTKYFQWFTDTPDGSQVDVSIAQTYNDLGDDRYIIEFKRLLDTGSYTDDIKLDFSDLTDQTFFVGSEDKHDARSFDVYMYELPLAADNELAEFEFDPVVNPILGALLITGHCYDDYLGIRISVNLSGWVDTYGPGTLGYAGINSYTGGWSYLFYYDENDMPIGDHVLTVECKPKYNESIIVNRNITIDDIDPPQIVGIVDLDERYPNGVPNGTEYLPVTVGVSDNYDPNDYLIVQLYYWRGNDVALMTPMVQFAPGSSTFCGNITLGFASTIESNNYTYFIQVWDTSNNKVLSEWHSFILGEKPVTSPPNTTLTEPTTSIGLGIAFINVLILGIITFSMLTYFIARKTKLNK